MHYRKDVIGENQAIMNAHIENGNLGKNQILRLTFEALSTSSMYIWLDLFSSVGHPIGSSS